MPWSSGCSSDIVLGGRNITSAFSSVKQRHWGGWEHCQWWGGPWMAAPSFRGIFFTSGMKHWWNYPKNKMAITQASLLCCQNTGRRFGVFITFHHCWRLALEGSLSLLWISWALLGALMTLGISQCWFSRDLHVARHPSLSSLHLLPLALPSPFTVTLVEMKCFTRITLPSTGIGSCDMFSSRTLHAFSVFASTLTSTRETVVAIVDEALTLPQILASFCFIVWMLSSFLPTLLPTLASDMPLFKRSRIFIFSSRESTLHSPLTFEGCFDHLMAF